MQLKMRSTKPNVPLMTPLINRKHIKPYAITGRHTAWRPSFCLPIGHSALRARLGEAVGLIDTPYCRLPLTGH